jgi:hypothetical protein
MVSGMSSSTSGGLTPWEEVGCERQDRGTCFAIVSRIPLYGCFSLPRKICRVIVRLSI